MSHMNYFAVFTLLVGVVRTSPINVTDSFVEASPRTLSVEKINRLSDELSLQMGNLWEAFNIASKTPILESVCKACMSIENIFGSGNYSEQLHSLGSKLCSFVGVPEERCNRKVDEILQTPLTESMADDNSTTLCESLRLCSSEGNLASEQVAADGLANYI